ncbi:MAG: hypothetical protein ABSC30_06240 [Acidimicrobiales bacterium]
MARRTRHQEVKDDACSLTRAGALARRHGSAGNHRLMRSLAPAIRLILACVSSHWIVRANSRSRGA